MMNARTVLAIVLIAAGTLGLVYRGFSYTRHTHEVKLGSLELAVADRSRIEIPMWASVGVLVVGVGLLLAARSK